MTTPTQKINFQSITKLPLRELVKMNGIGSAILIQTPNKGEVAIDTQKVGGFFSRKVTERTVSEIGAEIQDLEREAKNYLLDKWINQ